MQTDREKLEALMARDGRVYIVKDRAQLATALSNLARLIKRIDEFVTKHKKKLTPEDRRRYGTAMRLLQERIERAEKIDIRLVKRAEV